MTETKFRGPIPYGRQWLDDDDVEAVVSVLKSDFLTQGSVCHEFEAGLKTRTHAKHCCVLSSATAALHLTYLALDVGPGDIVWTSPITFVATANAALMAGADIDFVDIDEDTGNIAPSKLSQKLANAEKNGLLPKILTVVHFGGLSADMSLIHSLCAQFDIKIIEDASHALGGKFQNMPVGACQYSIASIFSFHPVKIITSGEGGCVTSNSSELIEKVRLLGNHGITKSKRDFKNTPHGIWYYEQQLLGLNYRLSDIHAALGVSQLNKSEQFVTRRNEIASLYKEILPEQLKPQIIDDRVRSSYHLFTVRTEDQLIRNALYDYLHEENILSQVHYIPVHIQPYYRRLGFEMGQFPTAERFYSTVLSLPIFPSLQNSHIEEIGTIVKKGLIRWL